MKRYYWINLIAGFLMVLSFIFTIGMLFSDSANYQKYSFIFVIIWIGILTTKEALCGRNCF